MSKIQVQINRLVDEIQSMMESNAHLNGDLEKLEKLLAKTSIYWEHMDDENADYVQAVYEAIENKTSWS